MHSSLTIARIIGPVLSAVGIGLLANVSVYQEIGRQIVATMPFVYFSGALMLATGLAILNAHHGWTRDWRSLITAVGLVLTCIGTFRLVAPQFASFIAGTLFAQKSFFIIAGLVMLSLGGFLTFKGYVA